MTRLLLLISRPKASFVRHVGLWLVVAALCGAWPALADGGTISGVVTSTSSGAPIPDVWVSVYSSSGSYVSSAWTASDGSYSVAGLSTGSFYVKTRNIQGYVDELYGEIACPGGVCPAVTTGTPLSVTAGQTTTLNFALADGGSITGTVTDETSGAPLPAVWVHVYTAAGNYAGGNRPNASGVFTLDGLTTGTYFLRTANTLGYADELYAEGPCTFGSCVVTTGVGVSVTAGAATGGINFQLAQGGHITGTITDVATSAPLANKVVRVYAADGSSYAEATTNASGAYVMTGLQDGTYFVRTDGAAATGHLDQLYSGQACWNSCTVTSGTPIHVSGHATVSGVDLSLVPGGAISGTVTDAGTAALLSGIPVTIHDTSGVSLRTADTNASGQYTLSPLPAGTYYVRTGTAQNYANELYADVPCPSCGTTPSSSITVPAGATAVTVTMATTTPGIDFGLTVGGTITGTVTDAVSSAPISGATIALFTAGGASAGTATTNASGVYSRIGLAAGSYSARITRTGYYGEVYNNLPLWTALTDGTSILAAAGATTTANVAMQPASGPNDAATAAVLPLGTTADLTFSNGLAPDTVWYKFFVPPDAAGQDLRVNLRVTSPYPVPPPTGWVSDLDFVLLDSALGVRGIAISGSDDETIVLHAVPSGWYYINVPALTTDYADAPVARYTATIETGTGFGVGYLSGRVVDDQGQGVEQAYISVYGVPHVHANSFQTITTGPGGFFSIAASPGSHDLALTGQRYSDNQPEINIVSEYYADKVTLATADHVTVTAGQTTDLGDWAVSRGATVTGRVTDSVGAPLASATVLAIDSAGNSSTSVQTGADGNYTLTRVPVGGAKVRFSGSNYAHEYYNDQPTFGSAGTLATQPGVTISGVDAVLTAGGSLSGSVRDYQSNGLAADVWLYSVLDGAAFRATVTASAAGTFTFSYVKPGDYKVFVAVQGYPAKWYGNAGSFGTAATVTVTEGQTTAAVNVVLGRTNGGDMSGDGKSDILWHHATRGEVWTWPMDGATSTAQQYVGLVAEPGWEIRGVNDFTGDGKADILWRNSLTGMIYLWRMNGSTVESETYVTTVETAYDIVSTGDYNGDGKADLLWRQPTNGEVWLWLMDGATPLSQTYIETVDPGYVVQGSGDLNGDGKSDLVWRHATGGDVWVWLMNGATPTVAYVETVAELDYRIVGIGDHTGDGKADILWHHATRGEVWIWPMDGTTVVSQSYVDMVPETTYRIVGNGDYNGDGKADILWHHATRGEVWVWLMNGTTKLSETYVASVPEVEYQIIRR